MKRKVIHILVDILLIAAVFAITDYFMLDVFKSRNLWLELGVYIVFYGILFGAKHGVVCLGKQFKKKKGCEDR